MYVSQLTVTSCRYLLLAGERNFITNKAVFIYKSWLD